MHIAQIKQLQATDGWVDFSGQITKVGEVKGRIKSQMSKTPGQQYNVQKIQVTDETDNIGVWAYADKQYLPNQYVTVRGMLKEFNNVRYIDFATVQPSNIGPQGQLQSVPLQLDSTVKTTEPPRQAQQAPQRVPQKPNGQNKQYDARNTSIERQAAFKAACEYAGRWKLKLPALIEVARAGHYFIETGNNICNIPSPDQEITNPDYVGDNPKPTDDSDDIPF